MSVRKFTAVGEVGLDAILASSVAVADCHEVLRWLFIGAFPIFPLYGASFAMAFLPQLQLWHIKL
jgi:hypothetical protein